MLGWIQATMQQNTIPGRRKMIVQAPSGFLASCLKYRREDFAHKTQWDAQNCKLSIYNLHSF